MINRTVRNFEIKELIATGGMAAIYKAVQVSLERVVAIKILHGHLAQDKNFITRFEREAKAAANLKHLNIVNIIDYGKAEDLYFIAMEYIDGRSLKDLMASVKFMPHDIALNIVLQISRGLNHAHQKGMVHRDVKPANILIGYDGIVKIADFGLAQAQDLISVTVTGSIVGTPAYMSPEQAAGKKVDARTDIFSLGVVIYEMITGSKPFCGENYSSVIHEIITVNPPKPLEANPLISRDINDLVEKMLNKDLDLRYQDVADVSAEIEAYFVRHKTTVTKNQLGAFVSKPDEKSRSLLEKRKAKHFERGLYFMTLGYAKIDEAINEFIKVLHLEPDDAEAKKYLAELKMKKAKAGAIKPPTGQAKEPGQKRKWWLRATIITGVLLVLIIGFGILRQRQKRRITDDTTVLMGVLDISSSPADAAIYIDAQPVDEKTPQVLDSIKAGKHEIKLIKSGYKPYIQNFEIMVNDTLKLNPLLVKEDETVIYGSIRVISNPAGARVILDGISTDKVTPCLIDKVAAGSHTIQLVKKGYDPIKTTRNIQADTETSLSLSLNKTKIIHKIPPSPSRAQYSLLKVTVKPWAKIYIDDRYIETTPIAQPIRIPAGIHTIRLENPNFRIWQQKVTCNPDQTVTLDIKLETKDGFLKLTVKPWADVYIDGKFFETTPIAKPIKLTAGKHTIKLINPSYQTIEEQIDIPADKMLKKFVELQLK